MFEELLRFVFGFYFGFNKTWYEFMETLLEFRASQPGSELVGARSLWRARPKDKTGTGTSHSSLDKHECERAQYKHLQASQLASSACGWLATKGAPELLYIKFTGKEQTSFPVRLSMGKFRNSYEILRFHVDFNRIAGMHAG